MSNRALLLDANILIRAVLGIRVQRILETCADSVSFFVLELALSEAQEHLAALVTGAEATRRKRRDGSALPTGGSWAK
jgi:PIN domain